MRVVSGEVGQGEAVEDGGALLRAGGGGCLRPLGRRGGEGVQQGLQQLLLPGVVADAVQPGGLVEQGCRRGGAGRGR
ncbi:MAG: hypothetical protein OXH73_20855 [Caldilineaceae bacterium]|nr:hypothetical protein [Caldilineaceae bacterium]